jgi:putative transposase
MAKRRRLHGQGAKRGDLTGPNPTDRAKKGTKRSLIVEGKGGILSVSIAGANVHDAKLLAATVAEMIVGRPEPEEGPQNLCLDKGYDNPSGKAAAEGSGYTHHIRRIGEEKLDGKQRKKHPARRWVVERAGAWLNGCRAILIRWNKKSANYLGLIQLAASLLWYRRAVRLAPLAVPDEVLR